LNKAILTQGGDGTAVPAGMVGEMLGTLVSFTGGSTYLTSTTTNYNTNGTTVILTATLNKGIYLVSIASTAFTTAAADMYFVAKIGGTQIGISYRGTTGGSVGGVYLSAVFPVSITTDGTVLSVYGSGAVNSTSATNQMAIIRIAGG
jgi:hypothetical protein